MNHLSNPLVTVFQNVQYIAFLRGCNILLSLTLLDTKSWKFVFLVVDSNRLVYSARQMYALNRACTVVQTP